MFYLQLHTHSQTFGTKRLPITRTQIAAGRGRGRRRPPAQRTRPSPTIHVLITEQI